MDLTANHVSAAFSTEVDGISINGSPPEVWLFLTVFGRLHPSTVIQSGSLTANKSQPAFNT
jgi:hypothetical protein